MANTFKLKTITGDPAVAGTPLTAFTATTETVLVGLAVANLLQNSITIDIQMESSTGTNANVYIGKGLPIPSGSSLNALTGKIVMENGDVLKVTSSLDDSMDIALSLMEIT